MSDHRRRILPTDRPKNRQFRTPMRRRFSSCVWCLKQTSQPGPVFVHGADWRYESSAVIAGIENHWDYKISDKAKTILGEGVWQLSHYPGEISKRDSGPNLSFTIQALAAKGSRNGMTSALGVLQSPSTSCGRTKRPPNSHSLPIRLFRLPFGQKHRRRQAMPTKGAATIGGISSSKGLGKRLMLLGWYTSVVQES
jgi:hypothetical protein